MPKLYFASKSGKRVSFNNFLGNRYLYCIYVISICRCVQTLISQPENFQRDFHGESRTRTYHAASFIFCFYDPPIRYPVSSPLMRGAWSFMVARQDIAAMVTLYIHQGRAPASRSGCATLHSTAKVCIERMEQMDTR